jgi:cytochrome-b5 reductase
MSTKSTSAPLDLEGILARLEPHAKELGGLVVLLSFLALWLINQGKSDVWNAGSSRLPCRWLSSEPLLSSCIGSSKPRKVIDPVEWRSFKLVQKDHLSHNTAR